MTRLHLWHFKWADSSPASSLWPQNKYQMHWNAISSGDFYRGHITHSSMCSCQNAAIRKDLMTRLVMPRFPQHCMMGNRHPPQSLTVARSGPSPHVHSQCDARHLWCYGICTQKPQACVAVPADLSTSKWSWWNKRVTVSKNRTLTE